MYYYLIHWPAGALYVEPVLSGVITCLGQWSTSLEGWSQAELGHTQPCMCRWLDVLVVCYHRSLKI